MEITWGARDLAHSCQAWVFQQRILRELVCVGGTNLLLVHHVEVNLYCGVHGEARGQPWEGIYFLFLVRFLRQDFSL